jgi:hypothetical protein
VEVDIQFPELRRIAGKDVYIVRSHNLAYACWAAVRHGPTKPPLLLSLDHHTDNLLAFVNWLCTTNQVGLTTDPLETYRRAVEACAQVQVTSPASTLDAARRLRYDEHFDAAIRSGIIDHAYVINFKDAKGTPSREREAWDAQWRGEPWQLGDAPPTGPFTYTMPDNRIFILPKGCATGCPREPHTEECIRPHFDQAIETPYLQEKLQQIRPMAEAAGIKELLDHPFILDIDLDYFHTAKAMQPDDPSLFHALIRRSVALTIAEEPTCVLLERLQGEAITSETLLPQLLRHIELAQKHEHA